LARENELLTGTLLGYLHVSSANLGTVFSPDGIFNVDKPFQRVGLVQICPSQPCIIVVFYPSAAMTPDEKLLNMRRIFDENMIRFSRQGQSHNAVNRVNNRLVCNHIPATSMLSACPLWGAM
jgi:hypothetical protein